MKLQILLLIFFILVIFQFQTNAQVRNRNKNPKNNDIHFIDAGVETYTSGISGGGSGKDYTINIKILSSNSITFDSLWVGDKAFKTFLVNKSKFISNSPVKFKKGDTVTVKVSAFNTNNGSLLATAPIVYKGEGLLRYFVNSKPYLLTIKSFNVLHQPNRP